MRFSGLDWRAILWPILGGIAVAGLVALVLRYF